MQLWKSEYGTLCALETDRGLPPAFEAGTEVDFIEVGDAHLHRLAEAMRLPNPHPIRERLGERRRCFLLMAGDDIASYGWVTQGKESVGELERDFNLLDSEAYIWDCVTLPAWRKKGLYSALLSNIIYQLHEEGVRSLWIGASRENQPSVRGLANAGFERVADVNYNRFLWLTLFNVMPAPAAPAPLVSAAFRIMINDHERLIGKVAVGFKPA